MESHAHKNNTVDADFKDMLTTKPHRLPASIVTAYSLYIIVIIECSNR